MVTHKTKTRRMEERRYLLVIMQSSYRILYKIRAQTRFTDVVGVRAAQRIALLAFGLFYVLQTRVERLCYQKKRLLIKKSTVLLGLRLRCKAWKHKRNIYYLLVWTLKHIQFNNLVRDFYHTEFPVNLCETLEWINITPWFSSFTHAFADTEKVPKIDKLTISSLFNCIACIFLSRE